MDLIETSLVDPINHWYYAHKFWFIKNSAFWVETHNRLADIGAGSALFSKELLKLNIVSEVVAVDTNYPVNLESDLVGLEFVQETEYKGFSHFLLTDVLEHVEDDQKFLENIVSEAEINSKFIITVPALMILWSGHDVYLKHYRRYTKSQLSFLAKSAGLEISKVRYTYSTVFPIAWLHRKLSRSQVAQSQLKENSPVETLVLRALLLIDRIVSFMPFGVSLFLEGEKQFEKPKD